MAIIASADQDPETGQRRPRGGGKLSRSETVTVRLDPKLNYVCELAARAQRRTKSSFIEWAIEHALSSVTVPGTGSYNSGDESISDLTSRLWDTDEPDRLTALALHAPVLLTHDEQIIWKVLRTSGWFWMGRWGKMGEWDFDPTVQTDLIMNRVREKWDAIKAVADGTKPRSDFVELGPMRKGDGVGVGQVERPDRGGFDALDDDVPF